MQSMPSSYTNSFSVLGFQKTRTNHHEMTGGKRMLRHWTPSAAKAPGFHSPNNGDNIQGSCRFDCNCTLDTSMSSSIEDAMDEDTPSDQPVPSDERECMAIDERSTTNKGRQFGRNKGRNHLRVRFSPETAPEPTTRRKLKKRKEPSNGSSSLDCDSSRWYTKRELKNIQESCIVALRTHHFMSSVSSGSLGASKLAGDPMLDRFSERNRKRRKLIRWKMYETTKVIKEFETATGTKAPPELLSELLRIYSKPMEMDAVESALKMKVAGEALDPQLPIPMPLVPTAPPIAKRCLSGSDMRTQLVSDEMYATLAYARMLLSQQQKQRQRVPSHQQLRGL